MNHIFNYSRIPDDKTIIENLEQFKIMLEAQNFYCYQSQCDLSNLNNRYNKTKEKYKNLKCEYSQLLQINHEQKNEISILKLQLEFYNSKLISPVNYVNQNNYLQMNTNNQIQIPAPPPPPLPPTVPLIKVQTQKIQNTIMIDLIKELKSKIKPYDN
jgi:hypothetical protein